MIAGTTFCWARSPAGTSARAIHTLTNVRMGYRVLRDKGRDAAHTSAAVSEGATSPSLRATRALLYTSGRLQKSTVIASRDLLSLTLNFSSACANLKGDTVDPSPGSLGRPHRTAGMRLGWITSRAWKLSAISAVGDAARRWAGSASRKSCWPSVPPLAAGRRNNACALSPRGSVRKKRWKPICADWATPTGCCSASSRNTWPCSALIARSRLPRPWEKPLRPALSAPLTWPISYTKARRRGSRNRLCSSAIRNSINSLPTRCPCSTTTPSS